MVIFEDWLTRQMKNDDGKVIIILCDNAGGHNVSQKFKI
jgi:hypothetical protein